MYFHLYITDIFYCQLRAIDFAASTSKNVLSWLTKGTTHLSHTFTQFIPWRCCATATVGTACIRWRWQTATCSFWMMMGQVVGDSRLPGFWNTSSRWKVMNDGDLHSWWWWWRWRLSIISSITMEASPPQRPSGRADTIIFASWRWWRWCLPT